MSDRFFIIDSIVGRRIRGGRAQYLVHWQGYDSSHDSWEPEENLKAARDLIQAYNRSLKK